MSLARQALAAAIVALVPNIALGCLLPPKEAPADFAELLANLGSKEYPASFRIREADAKLLLAPKGHHCFAEIDLPFDAEIELQVKGEGTNKPELSWALYRNKSDDLIAPVRTAPDGKRWYSVNHGKFLIEIAPNSHENSNSDTTYVLAGSVITNKELIDLPITTNARLSFRLNPDSQSSWFRIHVPERSRLAMTFLAEDGRPWPFDAPPILIITDSSDHDYELDRKHSDANAGSVRGILEAGTYTVEVSTQPHQWPTPPLAPNEAERKYLASVTELTPVPVDPRLKILREWLRSADLNNSFEPLELLDYQDMATADHDEAAVLFATGAIRHPNSRFEDVYSPKPEFGKPLDWLKAKDIPEYLLRLRAHIDRHKLRKLEESFEQAQGTSLWEHIIGKISLSTGISAHDIAIYMPLYCTDSMAAEIMPGDFQRFGSGECMSASFGVELPKPLEGLVGKATDLAIKVATINFTSLVHKSLETILPPGARVSYLTDEESYIQAIVRGLKGIVIPGGRYWEKLQVSFALLKAKDNMKVRVIADGLLAAGIGDYPPDSQFTQNMEPENAAALTEYAAHIANSLRDTVSK